MPGNHDWFLIFGKKKYLKPKICDTKNKNKNENKNKPQSRTAWASSII